MTIQYQDIETGAAFDITELVSAAKWTTVRRGSPAKLELTVLDTPDVTWTLGGIVTYLEDGAGRFYGYVFRISRSQEGTVEITAYDQTRYLKNQDTYVFQDLRADEILRQIAEDYALQVGELPNTGAPIASLVADRKALFDIVLEALDRTLTGGGAMFYLWDDFGTLQLSQVALPKELPVVGEGSLATGFTHERSIDGETYDRVEMVREDEESGRRQVYAAQDDAAITRWGVLKLQEDADEGLAPEEIRARCQELLDFYDRPEETLSLSALALPGLRAGQVIFCDLPGSGIQQAFLVEEAAQDLMEETMELKVKVV